MEVIRWQGSTSAPHMVFYKSPFNSGLYYKLYKLKMIYSGSVGRFLRKLGFHGWPGITQWFVVIYTPG